MTLEQLQRNKLDDIASEYRAKGYVVTVHPSANETPSFLREWCPDLIAVSDRDRVVVEVKAAPEIESDRTIRIAEAVAANPPWRFELVPRQTLPPPQTSPRLEIWCRPNG